MAASHRTVLLLSLCLLLSVSAGPQRQQIVAHTGDDVTLPCHAPNNVTIAAVQWSRPDLERPVYMKSDGHLKTADQHPSYVNRVQLKFDKMKNGDLSLVLKNVNYTDEGTYECLYVEKTGGRRKRTLIDGDPISIIHLDVTGPGGGHLAVILSATLTVAAVVGLVGFVIYKKCRGRSESKSDQPGDDPDVHQQLQENETHQRNISPSPLNTVSVINI